MTLEIKEGSYEDVVLGIDGDLSTGFSDGGRFR